MIAGVDGCRAGWVVALSQGWSPHDPPTLTLCRTFAAVVQLAGHCEATAVDIPIGLPIGREPRACDLQARVYLAPGGATRVFRAPPRLCLATLTPVEFQDCHRALTGVSAAIPVWGIVPKLLEVNRAMTRQLQSRIHEFHPELSWKRLAGRLLASKHTSSGLAERRALLEAHLGALPIGAGHPNLAAGVAADDVYDALVGLYAAEAIRRKEEPVHHLPAGIVPSDERGLKMEIWY